MTGSCEPARPLPAGGVRRLGPRLLGHQLRHREQGGAFLLTRPKSQIRERDKWWCLFLAAPFGVLC